MTERRTPQNGTTSIRGNITRMKELTKSVTKLNGKIHSTTVSRRGRSATAKKAT